MFINDFVPKTLNDFVINNEIAERIERQNGLFNTIIYGPPGVGKFTLARKMINNYCNDYKFKIKNSTVNDNKINSSKYHFELFVNNYNYKDKVSFKKTLREFSDSKNVSTGDNNIVIIKNADLLSRENLLLIKKMSERNDKFITFILTAKNYSKLRSVLGNFFKIRVPSSNPDKLVDFFSEKLVERDIVGIADQELRKIIKNNNNNLTGILLDIEIIYLSSNIESDKKIKFKNEISRITKKIINNIFAFEYEELRKNIYELTTRNIEKSIILNMILKKILLCEIKMEYKIKFLEIAAEYGRRLAISNKEVIQIEAMCFEFMALAINIKE